MHEKDNTTQRDENIDLYSISNRLVTQACPQNEHAVPPDHS